jgi:hypothetical protein
VPEICRLLATPPCFTTLRLTKPHYAFPCHDTTCHATTRDDSGYVTPLIAILTPPAVQRHPLFATPPHASPRRQFVTSRHARHSTPCQTRPGKTLILPRHATIPPPASPTRHATTSPRLRHCHCHATPHLTTTDPYSLCFSHTTHPLPPLSITHDRLLVACAAMHSHKRGMGRYAINSLTTGPMTARLRVHLIQLPRVC